MHKSVLECQKLTYCLSDGRSIIDDVSFSIQAGDFLVVLGANGSGKSTLFKLVHRAIKATAGDVLYKQRTIHSITMKNYMQDIAMLSQSPMDHLCGSMTIAEHVKLYLSKVKHDFHSVKATKEYLAGFNEKFSKKYESPIIFLSGGEKQALALALVLMRKPSLLLLDEHTSALDPKTSQQIMQLTAEAIDRFKVTCMMTTHELSQAVEYGNRLIAMKDGRIAHTYYQQEKQNLSAKTLLDVCY